MFNIKNLILCTFNDIFLFTIRFKGDQLILSCVDFSFPALTGLAQQITFMFQRIILYPEVQVKAQKEIDHYVGRGRLPTLDDRNKYLNKFFFNSIL